MFYIEFSKFSVSVYVKLLICSQWRNMTLDDEFKSAAERAKNLSKRPSNDILLELYSLYKQANEGDVKGERPGFADFEGRAKFDSWKKLLGISGEDAKKSYMNLVEKLEKEDN